MKTIILLLLMTLAAHAFNVTVRWVAADVANEPDAEGYIVNVQPPSAPLESYLVVGKTNQSFIITNYVNRTAVWIVATNFTDSIASDRSNVYAVSFLFMDGMTGTIHHQ